MILPSPAALVIGHPGHELRLFRWLEVDHPTVFVLTDGSGRSGRPRLESTRAVLAATGCESGSPFGPFSDGDVYRAFLDCDVRALAACTLDLAKALAAGKFRAVVSDGVELYNPTHDLCWVVANLASQRAAKMSGFAIERFDFAVAGAANDGLTITLDDDAFRRKIEMAHRYEDIAVDIADLIARLGEDALRTEVFTPVAADAMFTGSLAEKPYFEQRGEEQVSAGRYATVLRYREHFLPLVSSLIEKLR
jgi:hypothetical protein